MTPSVTCVDDALNGRTTKSFIDQGAWQKALDKHGDYYLIQFGHNDQKPAANLPVPVFETFLQRYIDDVRTIGAGAGSAKPFPSLSRRTFQDGRVVEDLTDYVNATREVGAKNDITVIELNAISTRMLDGMTQEQSDRFDKNADSATGKIMATPSADECNGNGVWCRPPGCCGSAEPHAHLNPYGRRCSGASGQPDQLVRTLVDLGPDVVGEPAKPAAAN